MGIANFSPFCGRGNGLSIVLAPVQALVALFAPAQSTSAYVRPPFTQGLICRAPTSPSKKPSLIASNRAKKSTPSAPVRRLKIVREFEAGASRSCAGRLVISGRMADVCAELERLAG